MKEEIDIPNSTIETTIDEFVKGEKNRGILKDRLINLVCYEPLAEKYSVSVSTVKRIVYRYEGKVLLEAKKAIKAKGESEKFRCVDISMKLVQI